MYLTKKGSNWDGNSYKRFTKEQAITRLEEIVSFFMDHLGMSKMTHMAAEYPLFSIKDKNKYDRALVPIEKWCETMCAACGIERQELEPVPPAKDYRWYFRESHIRSIRNAVPPFLEEADKLLPLAEYYPHLRPAQKERYRAAVGRVSAWLDEMRAYEK